MLNEEQVGKVRLLMASSGWNDVVRPAILKRAQEALKALALYPGERSGEYKTLEDNNLRARIQECEWLLTSLHNEVATFDSNRRLEELDSQQNGANPQPLAANP